MCPICEVEDSQFFYDEERNDEPVVFVICKKCGLVYQNPRKSYDEFRIYYSEDFRKTNDVEPNIEKYIDSRIDVGKQILPLAEMLFYKNLTNMLKSVIFGKRQFKVLDVGCGVGGILVPFQEAGYVCKGIDIPSEYTRIGREQLAVHIEEVFIDEFETDEKYDIIILSHALEHFLEPLKYLKKINLLLRPNGIVYVEIPDIERPYDWMPLKYFFMLGHVYYYSSLTLNLLMKKSGFRNIFSESEKTPFLRAIYKKSIMDDMPEPNNNHYQQILEILYQRKSP